MSKVVDEIESLRALDRDALIAKYRELRGREPRQTGRAWVLRRLMWAAQERRLGGLSATARARLEEFVAEIELPTGAPKVKARIAPPRERAGGPSIGTTIAREYRGERLLLRVEEGGFRVEGSARVDPSVRHRSISAAAAAVCGQHVNGKLWWRVIERRRAS